MTKKDYELIANAVRDAPIDILSKERMTETLIARLSADNARFDADKFRHWCLV